MVGELAEKRADVCAGGLALTLERMEVVDYSFALIPTMQTLTVRNPFHQARGSGDSSDGDGDGDGDANTLVDSGFFLTVLAPTAWVGIFVMGVAVGLASVLISRKPLRRMTSLRTLSESLARGMVGYALSLIQLDSAWMLSESHAWSLKWLKWSFSVCGFLVFAAYTSDLTATMTAGVSEAMPKSFEELIEGEYQELLLHTIRKIAMLQFIKIILFFFVKTPSIDSR